MNISSGFSVGALCYPDKKALIYEGKSYTYAQLNGIIDGIAKYLSDLGVAKGDRVSLYMSNRPEWPMFYYAIVRAGAIAVCVPAAYKMDEMMGLVNDSLSSVLVTGEDLLPQPPKTDAIPTVKKVIIAEKDEVFQSILNAQQAMPAFIPTTNGDDVAAILYTGGTTGVPKGAMLTHRNIRYSAQNVAFHERTVPDDVGLCFMPLSHVFAQVHIMTSLMFSGGTLVLFSAFDADKIANAVNDYKVTRFYAVPTIYIRFLNDPEARKKLKSLRYVFSAASSMPAEIVRQWKEAFGIPISEAYGMTESASMVTFNHLHRHKIGSIGTPAGVVEVKLVDTKGNEVKQGERGEILVRGPNIMKGYFNREEETAATIRGGWLHSGDVGVFDEEGYLYIVDRIKDVIITGGENVYPKEVEDVLYMHEAVSECAVVGLPHPEFGESVTAFMTLKEGKQVDEKELITFCKTRLARFKVPKTIKFVTELPKTPAGKILRRELKQK